jgi:hypothetical protein
VCAGSGATASWAAACQGAIHRPGLLPAHPHTAHRLGCATAPHAARALPHARRRPARSACSPALHRPTLPSPCPPRFLPGTARRPSSTRPHFARAALAGPRRDSLPDLCVESARPRSHTVPCTAAVNPCRPTQRFTGPALRHWPMADELVCAGSGATASSAARCDTAAVWSPFVRPDTTCRSQQAPCDRLPDRAPTAGCAGDARR